ncbi:hypothetical protein [Ferruginivarius sediminum]|uniref:Uncharacterized protein n=1 Tax=Ferruginivarius sediminum TaxID=2661937 RepID=A0A369TL89_9PROT|nr:hypothetical protein [Ferruginivarius sediminum]RDD63656.1 hypothetical protein DRB17_00270 [Ferruginivarius sediminum]
MERWIFGTLITLSLAAPAALFTFDASRLNERSVPMLDHTQNAQASEGPVAEARAEGYLQAARTLLRSGDPDDHARACRLIAQAERSTQENALAELQARCQQD